jgi:hypothetical protein
VGLTVGVDGETKGGVRLAGRCGNWMADACIPRRRGKTANRRVALIDATYCDTASVARQLASFGSKHACVRAPDASVSAVDGSDERGRTNGRMDKRGPAAAVLRHVGCVFVS